MPQDMIVGVHYEKNNSSDADYLNGIVYMVKGWNEENDGVFLIYNRKV